MSDADAITKSNEDWPTRAADTVVGYVNTVRDATTGKAMLASRIAVYGLVLALLAPILLVIILILLVRGLTAILATIPRLGIETGEVWLSYLILSFVFFVAGIWLWRKKGK